jgi:hypothetical protein
MPLALFRLRNVATANAVGVLWAAAMFAWFFMSGKRSNSNTNVRLTPTARQIRFAQVAGKFARDLALAS